ISNIRRFLFVVPSLTRHSYSEYKSVHTKSGIDAILTPLTILYISNARTLLVTRLHLVKL
ncbi:hypothetical protein BU23DRAFT_465190, partial [Bimuria novae-zelandiae CBS 107.79]